MFTDKGKELFASLKIMALYQSPNQTIWVGTNNGLFKIAKNQPEVSHYLAASENNQANRQANNFITCLYEDKNGRLWLGTKGGGITVFNPATGKVERLYGVKNGLAHSNVCAILPGKAQELWISTDNGLSRLNLKTNAFRNFYTRDGLSSNEFNQGSAVVGLDGKLYFGTLDGIISFYPNQVSRSTKRLK